MAIDFPLTRQQRVLQLESRRFTANVLSGTGAAAILLTPAERSLASRRVYQAMASASFRRRCIAIMAGRENTDLIDTSLMAGALRRWRRGVVAHRAVGYALSDAKIAIEATRYLSWHTAANFYTDKEMIRSPTSASEQRSRKRFT